MPITKPMLGLFFIALSLITGPLYGQDASKSQKALNKHYSGPCGCSCESDCSCGCADGSSCKCSSDETQKVSDVKCHEVEESICESICTCGCVNGVCQCGIDGVINIAPRSTDLNPQRSPFPESDCDFAQRCGLWGVWLPECPVLFRPLLADPRQINYSVGWRFNDQALGKNIIDVSFGDTLAIYRWNDIGPCHGQLQLELEGALWAVFNPLHESSPLIDADYYVGFPVTYAFDRWQFRIRGYHVSTHIGDEFLIDNPYFYRRNPSAEFIDFFVSNDFTDEIRYYAGVGVIIHQDTTFKTGRVFAEAGSEVRLRQMGFTDFRNQLYGEPYYAMNFRFRKDFKHHIDQTYVLGYEIGKLYGLCRKLRFYLEYHDGYSLDGQFQKLATNYLSIRFSYGF